MLSTLELRHIIESAFLPLECKCEVKDDGCLSITISDNGKTLMQSRNIDADRLKDAQAIRQLIVSIKAEMDAGEGSAKDMIEP